MNGNHPLIPLHNRDPLRVMFVITSMPVGGAEMLLVDLVRGLDPRRFKAEVCCLKDRGPLGEELSDEATVHSELLAGKYDVRVLPRLRGLIRDRKIDAVVTVGAGDKMFWGRLAAWLEGVPVILSAVHSTGWPDTIGHLNRWLTPVTDAFIAVAGKHGEYLANVERLPACKIRVIPNGVDTRRFCQRPGLRGAARTALGLKHDTPVVGIVAAFRPEKNHSLFLRAAARLRQEVPDVQFLLVGDGPEREKIQCSIGEAQLSDCVHLLGSRADIPEVLAALDLFSLTSHVEANPVSILEAMAMGLPVVATDVGSISETVIPGRTGFLTTPDVAEELAQFWAELLDNDCLARQIGAGGRDFVEQRWSLDAMLGGYEALISEIYQKKCASRASVPAAACVTDDQPPTPARADVELR